MPRKKNNYIKTASSKSQQKQVRKAWEHEHWRYEYTRRKFYLDLLPKLAGKKSSESSLGVDGAPEQLKLAQNFVAQRCRNIFTKSNCQPLPDGICSFSWDHYDFYHWVLSALVSLYCRIKNEGDPSYALEGPPKLDLMMEYSAFTDPGYARIVDEYRFHNPYFIEETARRILERVWGDEDLDWLYETSLQYGFFPWQMIELEEIGHSLAAYNENGFPLAFHEQFIREDDALFKYGIETHFVSEDGTEFYVEEVSATTLYCYVNCFVECASPKKLAGKVEKAIYAFKKRRSGNSFGIRDGSVVQVCIDMKQFKTSNMKKALELLEVLFIKYKNWLLPLDHQYHPDNYKSLNTLIVPSEQTPFISRCVGLWVWDQVHIHGESPKQAADKVSWVGYLKASEIEQSELMKKYKHAQFCVDEMQACTRRWSS
ncbi:hypothetical protein [Pseudodesulfovibrio sp. zrk46]|uniref:hypothetical protein n=1 Tax=Pseudodesulfovibrio sp. zrk46 TaxID=2725288 RepID=UPI001448CAF7|nr:hypothetical protein [Pseudodesulfovibrio sp. zrk46]QJB56531.1 hypothetical protein HFN16_08970 [Pseudodesulfovibrio sp. zrk46]